MPGKPVSGKWLIGAVLAASAAFPPQLLAQPNEKGDAALRPVYLRCVDAPTVDCLLALGIAQARLEGSTRYAYLSGIAVIATATGHGSHAIAAIDQALADSSGLEPPNPHLAPLFALKADAQAEMGDAAAAAGSLDHAFTNAMARRRGYEGSNASALMGAGPVLARRGRFAQARQAYAMAVLERAPRAYEILGEMGVALARTGEIHAALQVAEQLRNPQPSPVPRDADDEPLPHIALSDRQARAFAHLRALATAARGAAEGGDAQRARRILQEFDARFRNAKGHSLLADEVRFEAAPAHARTGDAQSAKALLEQVVHVTVRPWTESAASLCVAGKVAEAQVFLERAKSLAKQAVEIADLAAAYAACGADSSGRKFFVQARQLADGTSTCAGDDCNPRYRSDAQAGTARRMIEAGFADLADGWAAIGRSNDIRLAVLRGRSGRVREALTQLEQISKALEPDRPLAVISEIDRARGEIFAARGEGERAKSAFDESRRNARAIEDTNERAMALIELAQVQSKMLPGDKVRVLLHEARVSIERTMLSGYPGVFHERAREIAATLSRALAQSGYIDEAVEVARALVVEPASSAARDREAALLADVVVAEGAAALAQKNRIAEALKVLNKVSVAPAKVAAALRVEKRASEQGAGAELRASRALTADLVRQADRYFLAVQNEFERRQLIGSYAEALRRGAVPGKSDASRLFALLVSESARIASINGQARARCELGYIAKAVGLADATPLFEQAIARIRRFYTRVYPIDPTPAGACAYWLRLSGDAEKARALLNELIQPLRKTFAGPPEYWRSATTEVLGAAIAHAEAENGEIGLDWSRLRP